MYVFSETKKEKKSQNVQQMWENVSKMTIINQFWFVYEAFQRIFLVFHFFASLRPLKKCAGKSTHPIIELKLCTLAFKLYQELCLGLYNYQNRA